MNAGELLSRDESIYLPNRRKTAVSAVVFLTIGFLGFVIESKRLGILLPITGVLCLAFGLAMLMAAVRGRPKLTLDNSGLRLDSMYGGKRVAAWNSLGALELRKQDVKGKSILTLVAKVIGPNSNMRIGKTISVHDGFLVPLDKIYTDVCDRHAKVTGKTDTYDASAADLNFGLADYKWPWAALAILVALVALFAVEQIFSVTPGGEMLNPSLETLFALGGLNRVAVLADGEWYRLFTAPFLHLDIFHLVMNGIVLFMAGALLERFVGQRWFLAIYILGAITGSLASLLVNPSNIISVGASGAILGLVGASYVSSYRLPAGSNTRHKIQFNCMQILIPSLLPIFRSASSGNVDYAAHVGGALGGAIVGYLLIGIWPETSRIPQKQHIATVITVGGLAVALLSFLIVAVEFPGR